MKVFWQTLETLNSSLGLIRLPIPLVGFANLAHMGAYHYMPSCFVKLSFKFKKKIYHHSACTFLGCDACALAELTVILPNKKCVKLLLHCLTRSRLRKQADDWRNRFTESKEEGNKTSSEWVHSPYVYRMVHVFSTWDDSLPFTCKSRHLTQY